MTVKLLFSRFALSFGATVFESTLKSTENDTQWVVALFAGGAAAHRSAADLRPAWVAGVRDELNVLCP